MRLLGMRGALCELGLDAMAREEEPKEEQARESEQESLQERHQE